MMITNVTSLESDRFPGAEFKIDGFLGIHGTHCANEGFELFPQSGSNLF